jgi:hypothetical protein
MLAPLERSVHKLGGGGDVAAAVAKQSPSALAANLASGAATLLLAVYALKSVGHFVCGAFSEYTAPDQHARAMARVCENAAAKLEMGERCHHYTWLGSSVGFIYAGAVEVAENTHSCGVVSCSSFLPDGVGNMVLTVSATLLVVALCLFRAVGIGGGAGVGPVQRVHYVEDGHYGAPPVRVLDSASASSRRRRIEQ